MMEKTKFSTETNTSKKSSKRKQKVTTIRDILTLDSVNNTLDDLEQHKDKIKGMIVICIDDDEAVRLLTTEMTDQQIVYMLEDVKFSVLMSGYEGD